MAIVISQKVQEEADRVVALAIDRRTIAIKIWGYQSLYANGAAGCARRRRDGGTSHKNQSTYGALDGKRTANEAKFIQL